MSCADGGAAFPTAPNTQPGYFAHQGMTLRDYFAAKAMQSLILDGLFDRLSEVPQYAYEIADAMLAERAK